MEIGNSGNWAPVWLSKQAIKRQNRDKSFLTAKVAVQQTTMSVRQSVRHKSWNSSVNSSPSQSKHSLRLTDQSEDSIRSAVSAEISFSI